jgi:hypothetical protein
MYWRDAADGIPQRSKAQPATDVSTAKDFTGTRAFHLATRCAGG